MSRSTGFAGSSCLFALALVGACSNGPGGADEQTAETTLAIESAPDDVLCLSVSVSGKTTFEDKFELTPGKSTKLKLSSLPVGNAVFTAAAFASKCKSVQASSSPSYVADPLTRNLQPGPNPGVTLHMHAQASAPVTVDFPDAEQDQCTPAGGVCTHGTQCCTQRCDFGQAKADGTGICGGASLLEGPLATLPESTKRADFRLNPPAVVGEFASPGPNDTTNVTVVFAADKRLSSLDKLTLPVDEGTLVLTPTKAPDGNGAKALAGTSFGANLPVSYKALRASQQKLREQAVSANDTTSPHFDGRELTREEPIEQLGQSTSFRIWDGLISAVDSARSLTITDASVVTDPTRTYDPCTDAGTPLGPWTFGKLMTDMAGTMPASDFVSAWLQTLQNDQTVNGQLVPADPSVFGFGSPGLTLQQVINAWPRIGGQLDLARAPFKLVGIVNRIDLAGNASYGAVTGAEGRLVFEMVNPARSCDPIQYMVIFEFGVPRSACSDLRDWAQDWLALGSIGLGTPAFNPALQALTDQFAGAGADPSKPNGSALNQLRTDVFASLSSSSHERWRLREFHLEQVTAIHGMLVPAPVAQTPDVAFNGSPGESGFGSPGPLAPQLGAWVSANVSSSASVTGPATHNVPLTFPCPLGPSPCPTGRSMRGGAILNEGGFWTAPGAPNQSQAVLSVNTCDGCHGRETGTNFRHMTESGSLSAFLTGTTLFDPRDSSVSHTFNDLRRRKQALNRFASASCGKVFEVPRVIIDRVFPQPIPFLQLTPVLAPD